ncbi:SUMF1/EgtB/PvdO family nonheme iron enzyme [Gaiella sp.]|uniref:formylglycine-generating enzyme family protein n=2 Tax=Gaiella sp. TaxID=2663207 RepID=UPI003265F03D
MTGPVDWRDVPAGEFTMGSDPAAEFAPEPDEAPQHSVPVASFRIGRTQVTNAEYAVFVAASGYSAPSHWPDGAPTADQESHPVSYISWEDARAFCAWAGGFLPTEAQWERAARGDDERAWPWGDDAPTFECATFGASGTSAVGLHVAGASPFGALDLAGNVWEWTASAYRAYPYRAADGREDAESSEPRVVRGGAYSHGAGEIRCSYRHGMLPGAVDHYVGFRLACAPDARIGLDLALVDVPSGDVRLGNDPRRSQGVALPGEAPQHVVSVPAFRLAATPVTNAQYFEFVEATNHPAPPHWADGVIPDGLEQQPVTYVDWFDAGAYCRWAQARLPTEAEWEKGARGADGRLYPWGDNEPEPLDIVLNQHNIRALAAFGLGSKEGAPTAVGSFAEGASPYGALDMAGNVWEWVSSAYAPYPYREDDGREEQATGLPRVLRGGSYASTSPHYLRGAMRSRSSPGRRSAHIGFRVARSPVG